MIALALLTILVVVLASARSTDYRSPARRPRRTR